jgi:hypothetical protein
MQKAVIGGHRDFQNPMSLDNWFLAIRNDGTCSDSQTLVLSAFPPLNKGGYTRREHNSID